MRMLTTGASDRWAALQRDLGTRLGQRLFDEIAKNPVQASEARRLRPSWSLALAYLLAALVHLTSVGLGIAGLAILVSPWNNFFVVFSGVLLLMLCFASRPRFARAPYYLLDRAEYPVLYQTSDRIAARFGTAPIDGLAMSADFGANYRAAGWRQKRYVELGAPLMAVLTPAERIAVIAHELSHGANGDPLRGQFLFGAVDTVSTWAKVLRPASIGRMGEGMPVGPLVSLLGIPLELLMLLGSELLFLAARAILLLVLRQSQRAEYLADLLAATVAGSSATQSALEKTYLFDVVDTAIRRHALTTPNQPIGPSLLDAVEALPSSELEKHRNDSRAQNWQVDSTHPPTALRVAMLAALPPQHPSDLLSAQELAALDAEVNRLVARTQRELINRQMEAVYG